MAPRQYSDEYEDQYGDPLRYDKNFKGPLSRRSCTDIICLLIFIVFLVCWGGVGWFAITRGDMDRLLLPTDSRNSKCGVDFDVVDKPYLVFFNLAKCIDPMVPITGCPTPQVCVEQCPDKPFIFSLEQCQRQNIVEYRKQLICSTIVNMNSLDTCDRIAEAVRNDLCAEWYLKSESFLKRCISPLPTIECPLIPDTYLSGRRARIKRDYLERIQSPSSSSSSSSSLSSYHLIDDQLDITPERQIIDKCEKNRAIGEKLLMAKMQKIDTIFARFVGNIIAHISNSTDAEQVGQMIVEDVIGTWWQIIIALGAAMLLCLIFIVLMRWLAAPLIWLSIIGVIAMLSFAIYYCTTQYIYLRDNPSTVTSISPNLNALVQSYLATKDTWMYLLIILSVILLIILLMVLVLRKRIIIAIALVKEGSKAVSSTTSAVFFPIFPWILQVGIIVFAVIVGLYLASVGEPVYKISGKESTCICSGPAASYQEGDLCDPFTFRDNCVDTSISGLAFFRQGVTNACVKGCQFMEIDSPRVIPYFHALNVVGFFWLVFFISALGEMVLAATFATWYWTFHKSDVPFFTLTIGLGRTIRYHLGTLAFGSLIITICRIIRVILEYIDHKLKKYDNAFTRAILCCLKCFFWCLETFLRFLNKNAYIMCAIHGKNFCASARDAFNLLMRNVLRVIALDKVTEFLFFLAKILVTIGMGALTYAYFNSNLLPQQLHYILVPVIIVMIGTYLIATVFFGVYSMAVDTLFLCFLEDCERNDGSAEKPFYMSKQLMRILGKKNEVPRNRYQ